jgi:lipopolysaccharide biosynthesis glycosyltransferase
VRDRRIAFVGAAGGLVNFRDLGIASNTKYFNAGVMLMNLKKWRQRNTADAVFAYLRQYQDIIRQEDQEGLNAVLFDDWRELDFSWNWQIPWRGQRQGKASSDWSPETQLQRIVHFTTDEKPWIPGCDYIERQDFFEYLDRTEWAGWRVPFFDEVLERLGRGLSGARMYLGRLRRSGIKRASRLLQRI